MKTIKGTVKGLNDISGNIEPLPGANVFISDSNGKQVNNASGFAIGAMSDENGLYVIDNVPDTGFITARFVGYKPQTLPYRNTARTVNFDLPVQIEGIEEVEIIGNRPTKKPNYYLIAAVATLFLVLVIYIVYRLTSKQKQVI